MSLVDGLGDPDGNIKLLLLHYVHLITLTCTVQHPVSVL